MRRPGVSLVEVMVAAVLLAIGVSGCVAALLGAARLRLEAAAHEEVAGTAERRLAWFEGMACLLGDTTITAPGRSTEAWHVDRGDSTVTLEGRAERRVATRPVRFALHATRRCP